MITALLSHRHRSHRAATFARIAAALLCVMALGALLPGAGAQTIVNSGTGQILGTYLFDFDTGMQISGSGADVWWEQQTSTVRDLNPQNSATIANLGVVDFSSVSYSFLTGVSYSTTPIDGNNDGTNQLVTGDVFAMTTSAGNLAKVLVTNYGYDLQIQWVTYSATPIPEPATGAALLAAGALAWAQFRRRRRSSSVAASGDLPADPPAA